MIKRFLYISDFFLEDLVGGAELNDYELVKSLECDRVRSKDVSVEFLKKEKYDLVIVSNFAFLKQNVISFLVENCSYVIYEHDFKWAPGRNPSPFENFIVPDDRLVYRDFYRAAKVVVFQSRFQETITTRNIPDINTICVSGNLWSEAALNKMTLNSNKNKKDIVSVIQSNLPSKGVNNAIRWCLENGREYKIISSRHHMELLDELGNYKTYCFLPNSLESFGRTVVEAKMSGVTVVTNGLVPAAKEEWFCLKPLELIEYMRERKSKIIDFFLEF